jgi:thiamine-monophosphate kinase
MGDDCAATLIGAGKVLLSSTDTLAEDVHFSLTYSPPTLIGRKLVNISVSDISGMGGVPLFLLLALTMPGTIDDSFVKELYTGVNSACREHNIVLIGGNISSTPGENPMVLTSTILGEAAPDDIIYRSGASAGDIIYVTGTLGDSALGLKGLEIDGPTALTRSPFREAVSRHLDPSPRLNIAKTIARNNLATSMMDVSDGIASDLPGLAKESNLSAVVDLNKLPHSKEMLLYMSKEADGLEMMLAGGEDYELLFTAKPENKNEIQRLAKEEDLRVTAIGQMEETTEDSVTVRFVDNNGDEVDIKKKGFDHYL